MSERRKLKLIHLASTIWFIICVGYLLVFALWQAGIHWLVIFSLSGHSALVVMLLISLYLFAMYRGLSNSHEAVEHPLTSTRYYMAFYTLNPFLGALAGLLGIMGEQGIGQYILGIALGTLATTFFVWVVIDPLVGLVEMLMPASREHRAERLRQAKALKEKKQKARDDLLNEILEKEQARRRRRSKILAAQAEQLADLLASESGDSQNECKAVDIGVIAWQTGGLSCMKQLHEQAVDICSKKRHGKAVVDYIPAWWDGIGNWQRSTAG